MNLLTLSTLSFLMSMDAFAVAVAKGSMDKNPKFIHAAKNGLFFGIVETIAPIIGFWLDSVASGYIKEYDHSDGNLGFILRKPFGGEVWKVRNVIWGNNTNHNGYYHFI